MKNAKRSVRSGPETKEETETGLVGLAIFQGKEQAEGRVPGVTLNGEKL